MKMQIGNGLKCLACMVTTMIGMAHVMAGEQTSSEAMDKAAPVQGTGFYLGFGGVGTDTLNQGLSIPNGDPGFPITTNKKSSFGGLGEIKAGYDWSVAALDPNFTAGIEVDGDGGAQEFSNTLVSGDPAVNGLKGTTAMAQGIGIVSLKLGYNLGAFRPYIGAGGGGAYLDTIDPKVNTTAGTLKFGTASKVTPAYRGFAGVDVFLSRNWALNLEYRYQVISDANFSSGKTNEIDFGDLKSQQVEAGFKYYFR